MNEVNALIKQYHTYLDTAKYCFSDDSSISWPEGFKNAELARKLKGFLIGLGVNEEQIRRKNGINS